MTSYIQRAIEIALYKSIMIAKLHAEYFIDEEPPFKNMPATVINQTQNQNQTQSITQLLDIQERVISEITKHPEGSKERTFLEKVKETLPSMKTGIDIVSGVLKLVPKSAYMLLKFTNCFISSKFLKMRFKEGC